MSVDGMEDDGDEKDETKRKSRNLSEKKRRDEFNRLVVELGTMVSPNNRKMDKTTVLKTSIGFLRQHNEMSIRSQAEEIQTDWKPMFLSNEEFSHLMLEALDGFIIVLGTDGHILYTSESMASLLGYMPTSLHNTTLYEIVADNDKIPLYNTLNMSGSVDTNGDQQLKILIHIRRSNALPHKENNVTELVELSGYFRRWNTPVEVPNYESDDDDKVSIKSGVSTNQTRGAQADKTVFVATGRLATPQLLRELPVVHQSQSEFTSKHSLEWKFLFVDHRAPPIIGYLTFELLGTSGYDYYHVDDLDQVASCHEAVMQTGEGTSCYYRFLTKGQQWIWLQTRYYITYHMWNSKPEFINATHKVVNYKEVLSQSNKPDASEVMEEGDKKSSRSQPSFRSGSPTWSSKSSLCGSDRTGFATSSSIDNSQGLGSRQGSYRQSRLIQRPTAGSGMESVGDMSCDEAMVRTDDDSASVASSVAPTNIPPQPSPGWTLTPAQQALQLQLKTKHAELCRRIAQQQAELVQLGEQLLLTHSPAPSSPQGLTVQQQQQSQKLQQLVQTRQPGQAGVPAGPAGWSPQQVVGGSPQHNLLPHLSPQRIHQNPQNLQQQQHHQQQQQHQQQHQQQQQHLQQQQQQHQQLQQQQQQQEKSQQRQRSQSFTLGQQQQQQQQQQGYGQQGMDSSGFS